jgi:hypothetical protein
MDTDKLITVRDELRATVNTMHAHFNDDLLGAHFTTCLSYGECTGRLHNLANMLDRDIDRRAKEEAAIYRPGVMLTNTAWESLKRLHDDMGSGRVISYQEIGERLLSISNAGMPWVGGDPE